MPYGDDYYFSIPRGYAPIVISGDRFSKQERGGIKEWGHTEVAGRLGELSVLRLDALTCFAAGLTKFNKFSQEISQ